MNYEAREMSLGAMKAVVFGAMTIVGIASTSASAAAILTFDTEEDYSENFRETYTPASLGWSGIGDVARLGSGTSAAIYDRTSDSGKDVFSNGTFSFDFYVPHSGSSAGLITHIPTGSETTGYMAFVSVANGNDILRIYKGANPTTGAAGTQMAVSTAANLSVDTWYTLVFTATESGSSLQLKASVVSTGATPTELWAIPYTDTTPLAAGQIGFRLNGASGAPTSTPTVRIDNVSIPEPATAGMVGGALLLALSRRRRVTC